MSFSLTLETSFSHSVVSCTLSLMHFVVRQYHQIRKNVAYRKYCLRNTLIRTITKTPFFKFKVTKLLNAMVNVSLYYF